MTRELTRVLRTLGGNVPTFRLLQEEAVAPHHYAHHSVESDGISLREELAAVVRALYVDADELGDVLREAAAGLGEVADEATIMGYVDQVTAAVVPPGLVPTASGRQPRPPQLEPSRNELGEVLAYLAARQVYGTVVAAKRIRHKEVPGQPTRGMDLLGIDPDPRQLVLGEVKVSTDADSPPAVVGGTDDSLRSQFVAYMADRERIKRELYWALIHAEPNQKDVIGRALFQYLAGGIAIALLAVLVRPVDLAATTDYGCFKESPEDFRPAIVRFCLISVGDDLAALARDVYNLARDAA